MSLALPEQDYSRSVVMLCCCDLLTRFIDFIAFLWQNNSALTFSSFNIKLCDLLRICKFTNCLLSRHNMGVVAVAFALVAAGSIQISIVSISVQYRIDTYAALRLIP